MKLDFPRIFGLNHFCQAFWKIVISNTVSFYPIDALNFLLSLVRLSFLFFFFFMRFYMRVCYIARNIGVSDEKGFLTDFENDFLFFPERIICISLYKIK